MTSVDRGVLDGPVVAALDVGGTWIKSALVDSAGRAVTLEPRPTRAATGVAGVIEAIGGTVDELLRVGGSLDARPDAVGAVVPGTVDEANGMAVFSANIGWRDLPMRELIEKRAGLPVAFGHDVRAGGLAEGRLGAARGCDDFLFLPVGTGVAGAMVLDGQPYSRHGYAGEIGHVVVDPRGKRCPCGARGCLETIASAAAIARRYGHRAGRELDARQVARAAAEGDTTAADVWSEAVTALATVLATYVGLLAPEKVIVGGGLAEAGPQLIDPLTRELRSRLSFQREPAVTRALLGSMAGCLGAGLMAHQLVGREVSSGEVHQGL